MVIQAAVLMGAGFLALAVAVFMPMVREVELGLTPSVKLGPALKDRQAELRSVFEQQKGDLEYCAHLLCGDPETARRLLEASWSQAASAWKGPASPLLRVYTLCLLVEKLRKEDLWLRGSPRQNRKGKLPRPKVDKGPLGVLSPGERIVVVLHEFANLTVHEIAGLTNQPVTRVRQLLTGATAKTNQPALEDGRP
ncbi:sigma factor-like helix-turn-helix DNA-binding protein [Paenarthrobacter sp. NPDC090520]|uniref:sigma factor-like helix-turn-helix DNA-binding protein n=1 Tax=Paenarthrobacter sp. NPDC090520 TaxID=3364382 RepID=UPI00381F0136